ncbi:PREDICTED: disintegrin and metalloproteinase domain-containing protein 20-like [Gekko japonicus]|uniref:Disintegrin and metalloproteinase domain-containing protein 20-like n=1 Tax=Gekko japonicus TaxID=146911 RepID=A0ABM1JUM8_GEKJA|nr:PREDICTED: disintegrin and metalloproteinase domain-containing protein 20-like [Gekko japonicus]
MARVLKPFQDATNVLCAHMASLGQVIPFISPPPPSSPPGFRYASYEVIIPKRQTPRYGHKEPQHVNYLLKIEGKSHLVYLRQKRAFAPQHFPVFTYSKEGDLQVDYPFIRDDCFYDGFVQGIPSSLIILSICSGGLRGVLRIDSKTYEIEPVPMSATFQHVVYRLEGQEAVAWCGVTQEEQHREAAIMENTENLAAEKDQDIPWQTQRMYAKLAVVVEHERYVQFGRNETIVVLQLLDIIHFVDSLYVPLGIRVALVGLEIWSERNFINISDSLESVLANFNNWRKNTFVKRVEHDAGHLLVYKNFGHMVGFAYLGTMCNPLWASGVESYTSTSLFFISSTVAHEQGHILGMKHDDKYCTCEKKTCIMAASHTDSDQFSNCSYRQYFTRMKSHRAKCVLIASDPSRQYKPTYCGNKAVDSGEQCDCGSKLNCESDPCCQSDCKLRSGVTCAFGECCSKCQYLPAGSLCRQNAGVCDLPEYCNGSSEWCPEDVYVQDGAPCPDGAYCYHGNCSTHKEQCKVIFGSKATVGSEGCFRELNAQGDRFGNCGTDGTTYNKCSTRDILCGRIQCENIDQLSSLEEHSTIIQTHISSSLCWGTDYRNGIKTPDIGAVKDGTPCDKDMMCINKECTNVSLLKYDCNVTKCQNRGICNSHKNCHCDYGWAPPYCLDKGYGGSFDSGPPPPHKLNMFLERRGLKTADGHRPIVTPEKNYKSQNPQRLFLS